MSNYLLIPSLFVQYSFISTVIDLPILMANHSNKILNARCLIKYWCRESIQVYCLLLSICYLYIIKR
ncbi:hypothetical protein BDF14DRAFT_1778116 [Spinellus fusiger]|nr:hypothetical protein BDF14DRAFT_1778116 [Spinellus fusiger]